MVHHTKGHTECLSLLINECTIVHKLLRKQRGEKEEDKDRIQKTEDKREKYRRKSKEGFTVRPLAMASRRMISLGMG